MHIAALFAAVTLTLAQAGGPYPMPGPPVAFNARGCSENFGILPTKSIGERKWLFAISAPKAITVSGKVEVSTERATYAFDLPITPVDRPIGGTSASYRSLAISFTLPTDAQIDTVQILPNGGSDCPPAQRTMRLYQADGTLRDIPHSAVIEAELDAEAARYPRVFTATFVRDEEPLTCANPTVNAKVLHVAEPNYPEFARATGTMGSVTVVISIDATGLVTSASIQKSSGSAALDQEAQKAAQTSTYSPAIARCHAVPGRYLFRVEFTSTTYRR